MSDGKRIAALEKELERKDKIIDHLSSLIDRQETDLDKQSKYWEKNSDELRGRVAYYRSSVETLRMVMTQQIEKLSDARKTYGGGPNQVLDRVIDALSRYSEPPREGVCRHCGLDIEEEEDGWYHTKHDGRSCGSLSEDTVAEPE